jgi:hypothetical protein
VAIASLFSYAIRTNAINRQTAIATTLVYEKMEEFRAASFTDAIWTNLAGSETLAVSGERFVRAWEISAKTPRAVTVIVYTETNALTRRRTELIRATTLVSPTF